jgi:hypothetical protein
MTSGMTGARLPVYMHVMANTCVTRPVQWCTALNSQRSGWPGCGRRYAAIHWKPARSREALASVLCATWTVHHRLHVDYARARVAVAPCTSTDKTHEGGCEARPGCTSHTQHQTARSLLQRPSNLSLWRYQQLQSCRGTGQVVSGKGSSAYATQV